MIRALLDTNICIYMIRGRAPQVVKRLRRRKVGTVGISTITLAELQFGVAKSDDPRHNMLALAQFIAPFNVVPFDDAAAATYGEVRGALERAGTPLDTLIAAHAKSLGVCIVTNNEREFKRVEGLRIENWID